MARHETAMPAAAQRAVARRMTNLLLENVTPAAPACCVRGGVHLLRWVTMQWWCKSVTVASRGRDGSRVCHPHEWIRGRHCVADVTLCLSLRQSRSGRRAAAVLDCAWRNPE